MPCHGNAVDASRRPPDLCLPPVEGSVANPACPRGFLLEMGGNAFLECIYLQCMMKLFYMMLYVDISYQFGHLHYTQMLIQGPHPVK